MGITGVVRDKDTELGIADAVIAVEGINHDVTTGIATERGAGGLLTGQRLKILELGLTSPFVSSQLGVEITGGC